MPRLPRTYNPSIYNNPETPYKISRSKIELFIECPRCFYLDRVKGVSRPSGPAFTLNSAVDALLKKEFDAYRKTKKPHPIMIENNVDAVPFDHPDINDWRNNFKGVQTRHSLTNLLVFGAVDDIWEEKNGRLIVADYKSTAKSSEVSLDTKWTQSFKRQVEVYQWLLRQNGFKVNNTAYFVYANGILTKKNFKNTLTFNTKLLSHMGDDNWIEPVIKEIKNCLESNRMPDSHPDCEFCKYRESAAEAKD